MSALPILEAHIIVNVAFAVRTTSKGGAVRPLKGNVSWVQTVVRQVGFYLPGMLDD